MKPRASAARLLLIMAVPLVACCGWSDEEEPEATAPTSAPKLVGRISSVHDTKGFVLVESYGRFGLGEGLLLSSVGDDGRTATLMASGEKSGRFSAADLKSGNARVGDLVYGRPLGGDPGGEAAPSGLGIVGAENPSSAASH